MANRALQLIVISLFFALATTVGLTWWYAYDNGYLPSTDNNSSMGGPWSHNAEMTQFVDHICVVGSLTILASLTWVVAARSARLQLTAGALMIASVSIIGYHVLLID